MKVYVHKARGMPGVSVYATREAVIEAYAEFLADGDTNERLANARELNATLDAAEQHPGADAEWGGNEDTICFVTVQEEAANDG